MRFSIILPVRNGGHYVKECVSSILAQTYPHFNLIILDNCSTDGTSEYISSLNDPRIVVYPSGESLSIDQNWARITGVPKNEFMTCIGHDDVLLPGYLETMNALIEQYPRASLYQTQFNYINAGGGLIRPCKPMQGELTAAGFLEKILAQTIDLNGTGFMTRSKDYEAVGGIPMYPNLLFADFPLWLNITRIGGLAISPANCFSYRIHVSTTTVSSDEKFLAGFDRLMEYLYSLKQESREFDEIINAGAANIIGFYCKSLSHRLLRRRSRDRKGQTVAAWIAQCEHYADRLIDNNTFHPSRIPSVRLAKLIDATAAGRSLFLLFKKVYRKPVL